MVTVFTFYAGKELRILGMMDDKQSKFYPGVKTFEEQGYKLYNSSSRGFTLVGWHP